MALDNFRTWEGACVKHFIGLAFFRSIPKTGLRLFITSTSF